MGPEQYDRRIFIGLSENLRIFPNLISACIKYYQIPEIFVCLFILRSLESLADKGNGRYAYVDTIAEARRIFEENLTGTLQVVARNVKVQVDLHRMQRGCWGRLGY